MIKKRGQASLEFTLIFGFAIMMLIPIIIIYGTEKDNIKNQANMVQAGQIAKRIVNNVDKVYFLGKPSQTKLTVNMPSNVENIVIDRREIYFYVNANGNSVEISSPFPSSVNMTGLISPNAGMKTILIKAEDNYVNITSG